MESAAGGCRHQQVFDAELGVGRQECHDGRRHRASDLGDEGDRPPREPIDQRAAQEGGGHADTGAQRSHGGQVPGGSPVGQHQPGDDDPLESGAEHRDGTGGHQYSKDHGQASPGGRGNAWTLMRSQEDRWRQSARVSRPRPHKRPP